MKKLISEAHVESFKRVTERDQRGPIAFTPVQSNDVEGHFGLGVAVANERGYHPVTGRWAIYETYDEATDDADRANKLLGLSDDEVIGITVSTMGGQRYQGATS